MQMNSTHFQTACNKHAFAYMPSKFCHPSTLSVSLLCCHSHSNSDNDPFSFYFPTSIYFSASLPLPLAIQTGSSCRLSTQHTCSQFSSIAWAARHPGPAQGKHTSWLVLLCSSMNRYRLEQDVHSGSHL